MPAGALLLASLGGRALFQQQRSLILALLLDKFPKVGGLGGLQLPVDSG